MAAMGAAAAATLFQLPLLPTLRRQTSAQSAHSPLNGLSSSQPRHQGQARAPTTHCTKSL